MPNTPAIRRDQPCDLCGRHDVEPVSNRDRRGNPLATVVCRHCGLVSHETIPTDDELDQYYRQDYRQDYHGELTPGAHRVIRAWQNGGRLVNRLRPFIDPSSDVFEVGAGIGCTVKQFELAGMNASGIEPNAGFQSYSRNRLQSRVHAGRLTDATERGAYDLVLLIHVIEHFNSPRTALEHIHGMLRPNGLLYVECPNLFAPHAAPGKQFHYAHIHNFTPWTLAMLAESCGFVVRRRLSGRYDRDLGFVLERADRPTLRVERISYIRSVEAINRHTQLTYHLRPAYAKHRITQFVRHAAQHVAPRLRVRRIEAQCRQHADVQQATQPVAHKRAA